MNKPLSFISIVTFVLLYIRGVLGCYDVQTIYLTLLINVMLFFVLFFVHFSGKILLFLIWGLVAVIHSKESLALVDLVLFSYIIRKEDLVKYVNWGFLCSIITFISILFLIQSGIIKNHEIQFVHKGKVIANSMGMGSSNLNGGNPNMAGLFFYNLLTFGYLRFSSQKYVVNFLLTVVIAICSFLVFEYTQARAVLYSLLIMCVVSVFMPIIRWFSKLNKIILTLLPLFIAVVSFYISLNLNLFYDLDQLTSDRVSNPAFIMAQMNIVDWLIGVNIPKEMAMDSSYLTILFEGGILIFIFLFTMIAFNTWRNYDSFIKIEPVIVSLLAYGCMENIFSSFNCLSVIFFASILFSQSVKKHKIRTCHYETKQRKSLCPSVVHASE